MIAEKTRRGDRDVTIEIPPLTKFQTHSAVIVDDVISSAGTMSEIASKLSTAGHCNPTCISVHGLFSLGAEDLLKSAGSGAIVTSDSIFHSTNGFSIAGLLAQSVGGLIK